MRGLERTRYTLILRFEHYGISLLGGGVEPEVVATLVFVVIRLQLLCRSRLRRCACHDEHHRSKYIENAEKLGHGQEFSHQHVQKYK